MKRIMYILAAGIIITYTITACSNNEQTTTKTTPVADSQAIVKRGEYLVATIGCDDCHSPKKMGPNGPEVDMDLRFSGYPSSRPLNAVSTDAFNKGWLTMNMDLTSAAGPWGVSFSANISSDSTGIGCWSQKQFVNAIRKGVSKGIDGNRPLLPPMPWQNFSKMSDDDLNAIYAYLKTTKPVHNVVPQPMPPAGAVAKN